MSTTDPGKVDDVVVRRTTRSGNILDPSIDKILESGQDVAASADGDELAEVKQLGLMAGIASLGYVFWICGGMEMIERLAYYGVRSVATLYGVDPVKNGGLGVTFSSFGNILAAWAFFQSVVPIFTGGLSDRYGYKETIFASTVVKISGYLVMAFFPTYWGFGCGALLLATGTAIFKPGIQATFIRATKRENSSIAWGVFYQTVNLGGFIGPLVAGYMRKMAWTNVFLTCAAVICLNFLMLLTYQEPGKEERLERARLEKAGKVKRKSLAVESLIELRKPHVWTYLAIFSGFWFMFNAMFDILPNHIQDWVDTSSVVATFTGGQPATNPIVRFFFVLTKDGMEIQPEGMLNINFGLIMTVCFLLAALSGRLRATTSMLLGVLLATTGLFMFGYFTFGWLVAIGIIVFSVGEMLSSPKFSEFIGNFAPKDKKAMYMGFSQIPLAIGWTLEGKYGPVLYDMFASKERFSRELLVNKGMMAADAVAQIKEGEAFSKLVELSHVDKWTLTHQLYATHSVGTLWYIMAGIGTATVLGIFIYGRWMAKLAASRQK